jgi:hypothetical protein
MAAWRRAVSFQLGTCGSGCASIAPKAMMSKTEALAALTADGACSAAVDLLRLGERDQNPSGSLTKIADIRPGGITLLTIRMLFTPLGTR